MKKIVRVQYVLLSILGLLAAGTAHAQVTLTFNENGATSATGGTDPYVDLGLQTDVNGSTGVPSTPTNIKTLDYGALLSGTRSTGAYAGGGFGTSFAYPEYGWVAIYSPGSVYGSQTGLLDLILFDNSIAPGGPDTQLYQSMFWYSDEGSGNLADTLSQFTLSELNAILAPSDTHIEYVTENAQGLATYTPINYTMPGYAIGATNSSTINYTYDFQSSVDPVPEPSTVVAGALLLLPLGISSIRVLYRKRAV